MSQHPFQPGWSSKADRKPVLSDDTSFFGNNSRPGEKLQTSTPIPPNSTTTKVKGGLASMNELPSSRSLLFGNQENVGSFIDSQTEKRDALGRSDKHGLKMSASMRIDPDFPPSRNTKSLKTGESSTAATNIDQLLSGGGSVASTRASISSPRNSNNIARTGSRFSGVQRMTKLNINPYLQKGSPFKLRIANHAETPDLLLPDLRADNESLLDKRGNGDDSQHRIRGSSSTHNDNDVTVTGTNANGATTNGLANGVRSIPSHVQVDHGLLKSDGTTFSDASTAVATPTTSALQDGYWVNPPLSELCRFDAEELKHVDNLIVGRKGFGQVKFIDPVDISNLGNLGDLLGKIVAFSNKSVCVYPNDDEKPHEGTELNVPAIVTLDNCGPKLPGTSQPVYDPSYPSLRKHMKKLKQSLEQNGGKFITYVIGAGLAVFRVEHFSTYTVPEFDIEFEEDLVDKDADGADGVDNEGQQPDDKHPVMSEVSGSLPSRPPQRLLPTDVSSDISKFEVNDTFAYKNKPPSSHINTHRAKQASPDARNTAAAQHSGPFTFGDYSRNEKIEGLPSVRSVNRDDPPDSANRYRLKKPSGMYSVASFSDNPTSEEDPYFSPDVASPRVRKRGEPDPSDVIMDAARRRKNHSGLFDLTQLGSNDDEDDAEIANYLNRTAERGPNFTDARQVLNENAYVEKVMSEQPFAEVQMDHDMTFNEPQQELPIHEAVGLDRSFVDGFAPFMEPGNMSFKSALIGDDKSNISAKNEELENLQIPQIGFSLQEKLHPDELQDLSNDHDWTLHLQGGNKSQRGIGFNDKIRTTLLQNLDLSGLSDSASYAKVATKLRLPGIDELYPIGRFSPGTDRIVIRNSTNPSRLAIKDAAVSSQGDRDLQSAIVNTIRTQLIHHTTVRNRNANGFPFSGPSADMTFRDLAQSYSRPNAFHEEKIWELCAILFDNVEQLGLTDSLDQLDDYRKTRVIERFRHSLLSTWLSDYVTDDLNQALESVKDGLEKMFVLLTGFRIEEASKVAVDSGNLHLATLLPMLGSGDEIIKESAVHQLNDWTSNETMDLIPPAIRKVYELLTGEAIKTISSSQTKLFEGLDWKRAFGLVLWYHTMSGGESIDQAVSMFTTAMAENPSFVRPSEDDPSFVAFKILCLYNSINPDLVGALDFPASSWKTQYRIPWYIYIVLSKYKQMFKNIDHELAIKLSLNFGVQLLDEGLWQESIYVLSYIEDDNLAESFISKALSSNISKIHDPTSGQETLTYLLDHLKIPKKILFEVDALRFRWIGSYYDETISLISAEMWNEAHNTVISRVAPRSVITNDTDKLLTLLDRFENPAAVESWYCGGGLYMRYCRLRQVNFEKLDSQQQQNVAELIQSLVDSLALIPTESGGNREVRVAISIIGSYVFDQALKYTKIKGLRLLKMKMGKNDHLKQTLAISSKYFLEKAYI